MAKKGRVSHSSGKIPNMKSTFADYVVSDLLADVEGVRARAMFGGYGIYQDSLMFAIIVEDELYYKVSDLNRKDFEARGSEPFTYQAKGNKRCRCLIGNFPRKSWTTAPNFWSGRIKPCEPPGRRRGPNKEVLMPKYVIERNIPGAGKMSAAELKGASQKSCGALRKLAQRLQWLQSY